MSVSRAVTTSTPDPGVPAYDRFCSVSSLSVLLPHCDAAAGMHETFNQLTSPRRSRMHALFLALLLKADLS